MENNYIFEKSFLDNYDHYPSNTLKLGYNFYSFYNNEDIHYELMNYEKSNPNPKIQNEFQLIDSTTYKSINQKEKENKNDLEIENAFMFENIYSIKNQEIKYDLKNNYHIQNKHFNEKDEKEIIPIPKKSDLHLENSIIKENINQKDLLLIDNSEKYPEVLLLQKKKGRKKKASNEQGIHDKFWEDNIIIKIKADTLNNRWLSIINEEIKKYGYNNNDILFKIDYDIIKQINATFNRNLLNSKLKDILSYNIAKKYTNHKPNHNKILIEKLYKNQKLKEIFDLTYLQFLKYLRGDDNYKDLLELKRQNIYLQLEEGKENDENYIEKYNYILKNFEVIINSKKTRNRKK